MIALPYLSAIRFSGTDAGNFLHNQLSADILALPDRGSSFACYCEPKGRVLALMLVCRMDEDFYVVLSGALAQTVSNRLKIYVMRSKVSIEVISDLPVSALQEDSENGPATSAFIGIPVPVTGRWLALTKSDSSAELSVPLQKAWKASELKQGICWLDSTTSGQFLPQMLGFEQLGAVNYRKGCYPGQEIVARTHYLGKVKRHPRLLSVGTATCPEPLEKIKILSDGQSYEAIVVDCEHDEDGNACMFVVTRMDPALHADHIEFRGESLAAA